MERHSLKSTKRTVIGRKVKTLRKQGILPGVLYGKTIQSHSIQLLAEDFLHVFTKAGETGLIDLHVDGKIFPTIIHNVQFHPILRMPIHVDFFNVNLTEKITAKIPIAIIGESPAVKDKLGVLLTVLDEIEVEALPTDLPEHIEVNISTLTGVDQNIKVKDLVLAEIVKILSPQESDIVQIAPLVSKEAQQMAQEDKAKTEAEAAEAAQPTATGTVEKSEQQAPADTPKDKS